MSLFAIDAGHGGYDNGASYEGRLEKDDNLRLALAVRDELIRLGQDVVMTRDTDVFVPLDERANIANNAGADLFISLHRNSYPEQLPTANGVENYIYTYATDENERMARLVLDKVVAVGVQQDRGVNRANFAVLRYAEMPSMLLEMGFINNEEDNRLFDKNLQAYARAIAQGAVEAVGAGKPSSADATVKEIQTLLNEQFGASLAVDGIYGPATRRALIRAIQTVLNNEFGASLAVDGIWGPKTRRAVPNLRERNRGNLVKLLQAGLYVNGFDPGRIDGIFGPKTAAAVRSLQSARGLAVDGIAGPFTFQALFQ